MPDHPSGGRRHPRRPFVMVPTALLYDPELSPFAKLAWAVLDDLCRAAPAAVIDQASWARAIGITTTRGLRKLIGQLVDAGFLDVIERPGQPSAYRPLLRARPVDNPASVEDLPRNHGAGDPGTTVPGLTGVLHARTEKKITEGGGLGSAVDARTGAPATTSRRPTWCGRCDEHTRMDETADGRARRCPTCHPLASRAPLF